MLPVAIFIAGLYCSWLVSVLMPTICNVIRQLAFVVLRCGGCCGVFGGLRNITIPRALKLPSLITFRRFVSYSDCSGLTGKHPLEGFSKSVLVNRPAPIEF